MALVNQLENSTGDDDTLRYNLVFVPVLLAEFILSIFSNTILLFLICRSLNTLTNLNVFLLSLGLMNLILSVDQIVLMALIFKDGQLIPIPICHMSYAIQAVACYGITLLQLGISYNRYRTVREPFHWENTHIQAWTSIGTIWGVVLVVAALQSILNIGGIRGDVETCFWPVESSNIAYKFFLCLVIFIILLCAVITTYYYHWKAMKLLRDNRRSLEQEMTFASNIQFIEKGPERTSVSLIVISTIHTATVLLPQFFNTVRILILWVTRDEQTSIPITFLVALACTSLFTTVSPLFFMIISPKFKENVKNIFKCKCKENIHREERVMPSNVESPVRVTPTDLSIFVRKSSILNVKARGPNNEVKRHPLKDLTVTKIEEADAEGMLASTDLDDDGQGLGAGKKDEILDDFYMDEKDEEQFISTLESVF